MDPHAAAEFPVGRHLAIDERGIGLRATWRLDHGFLNLSLWRDDVCVETFHLTPAAAASLIGFLARGLGDATAVAATASVRAVRPDDQAARRSFGATLGGAARAVRRRTAEGLTSAASRVAPLGIARYFFLNPFHSGAEHG